MLILGSLDLYLLQYLTITTKTTLKSIAATNIIVSDPITPPSTAPTLNDGVSRAAIIKNNVLLQCRHEKCIRANVHSATFLVHLISSKLQDMCIIIYIDCKKSEQEILHYPVIVQEFQVSVSLRSIQACIILSMGLLMRTLDPMQIALPCLKNQLTCNIQDIHMDNTWLYIHLGSYFV